MTNLTETDQTLLCAVILTLLVALTPLAIAHTEQLIMAWRRRTAHHAASANSRPGR